MKRIRKERKNEMRIEGEKEIEMELGCEKEEWILADVKQDNRGIGVVEIILILVILIGLVLLFQNEIKGIVNDALDAISGGADKIID